eukprot:6209458-Pyramimonas_sp.AAC.2
MLCYADNIAVHESRGGRFAAEGGQFAGIGGRFAAEGGQFAGIGGLLYAYEGRRLSPPRAPRRPTDVTHSRYTCVAQMDMWLLKGIGALAVTAQSALLPVVVD